MELQRTGMLAVMAVVACVQVIPASAEPLSNLEDLGFLAAEFHGGTYSAAVAVNDDGLAAGNSTDSNGQLRAVVFDHGLVTEIGVLDNGYESYAVDLNEAGQVVGTSAVSSGGTRAFLYQDRVLTNLGVLPGGGSSEAVAINDVGLVTGYSSTATSYARSFLWENGIMTNLGDLGGDSSYPTAINSAGQVAGYADTATERHAFLYSGGSMIDLGTLGGSQSEGHAINEAGDVTGRAFLAGDGESHAFRYHAGVMEDLGTLGGTFASGYFINGAGDVVGSSTIAGDAAYHPFLYRNGVMTDIGTPGALQDTPVALDEDGNVLGYTIDAGTFQTHSWVYRDGTRYDIGDLAGGGGTFATAWNRYGLIAGSSRSEFGDDRAFLTRCSFVPRSGCQAAPKAGLSAADSTDDVRDQMTWKWSGGGAIAQADFGDPATAHGYRVCLYDATAGSETLVSAMSIHPGSGWTSKSPKGWRFSGGQEGQDGVSRILLKTGEDGRSKILVKARGQGLPVPEPHSATELFDLDPQLTIQLARDGGADCWSSGFDAASVVVNSSAQFVGKLP